MKHYVYILYSSSILKYYIGESAFPVERLIEHNEGRRQKAFTKQTSDWQTFLLIECDNRAKALKIEKKIKSMKSTKYIQNLKKYPEMVDKLQLL
ncbi:GIY-YIG nuclease family protein [Jiulongibacter sediminis]|nr:GIY-YIG nuclease family protein [Jiulongibacter sediminis]TBX24944.1 hypothetical protein TK44_07135 [Jiulongibacter sediminis]